MRLLTLCLFALGLPAAFAADKKDEKKEKPPVLAGKYTCEGEAEGGGKYEGTVEITESGAGFTVEWTVGNDTFSGVGIWENDRLCVSWTQPGGAFGVIVYKREKDGTLKGKWTGNKIGEKLLEETLTPEKK
jgi:hypothetical protein